LTSGCINRIRPAICSIPSGQALNGLVEIPHCAMDQSERNRDNRRLRGHRTLILELCRDLPLSRQYLLAAGAATIYATTPIVWLYSCLAEIYPIEGFFTALVSYLVIVSWRKPRYLLWASVAIAIAGGFRPTTEFFLVPFYAAGYFGKDRKTILNSLVLLLAVNGIWMTTLVSLTGGLSSYRAFWEKCKRKSLPIPTSLEKLRVRLRIDPLRLIQACSIPLLLAL
jgi:hypothetical protein